MKLGNNFIFLISRCFNYCPLNEILCVVNSLSRRALKEDRVVCKLSCFKTSVTFLLQMFLI